MNFLLILAASTLVAWEQPEAVEYSVTHFTLSLGIQSVVAGNLPVMVWTINYPLMQQQVDGLDYGTKYYVAVKSWNVAGSSGYSGELEFTLMPDVTPTPTPTPEPTAIPTPTPLPEITPPEEPPWRHGWRKDFFNQ
jgi:hypothetical protein